MANKYYVVEFRFPIQVNKASSVMDASNKAAKMIEKKFGFLPSGWFARVFEYSDETVGPKEFFCSPGGTKFRPIDKNIKHEKVADENHTGASD